MAERTVLASWASTVVDALVSAQLDGEALLAAAGLRAAELHEPGARIPASAMAALWQAADAASSDPGLGLRISKHVGFTTFHALGYSVLASASLCEALDRMVRYSHLVSEETRLASHARDDGGLVLELTILPGYEGVGALMVDAAMGLLLRICRFLAGDQLAPLAVSLARPEPQDIGPYSRFFRAPIRFGGSSTLEFAHGALDQPLAGRNPELARINDDAVRAYLSRMAEPTFPERVRSTIARTLPGAVTPSALAKELGTSVRSMQRTLQREGTSYEAELRAVRRELAVAYLEQGVHPVSEVAYRVGYQNLGAFSQAFTRWTGSAPLEYARRRRSSP